MTRAGSRGTPRRGRALAAPALLLALLPGCQPEEKVVHYKPFLTGIEGAKTQTPAVLRESDRPTTPGAPEEKIIIVNADGTQRLVTHSANHLIAHIKRTLADDDAATFTDQVLSEESRRDFVARGKDPLEAFAMVKADEKEIMKLLSRMPMGENTPFVLQEASGDRAIRVRVTGLAAKDLKWTGFDMVLEKGRFVTEEVNGKPTERFERGNWRLLWFVP